MDNEAAQPRTSAIWKPAHTYTMAVVCLVIGLAIGYFLRGSAASAPPAAAMATAAATGRRSARRHGPAANANPG